ncbi:MAG: Cof-type HAD-IIB family hydrolase [Lachnospiraceae bacterium]|nr:Cof-type HAD-IIB family hydrolase [Lachnospiraceae bacterium]
MTVTKELIDALSHIKMVVTDIDGTLMEEGQSDLPKEYFTQIQRLEKKGILFVPATGRSYDSAHKVFLPILDKIMFISDNGARVMKAGKTWSTNPIPYPLMLEMLQDVEAMPEFEAFASGPNIGYCTAGNEAFIQLLRVNYQLNVIPLEHISETLPEGEYFNISVYHPRDIQVGMENGYYDKWHAHNQVDAIRSGKLWMNMVKRGVDKGSALKAIMDKMDLKPEQVLVFGDNTNDMGMLSLVENSVAIGNAREEVKKCCKYVAKSCKENGVLEFLQLL